MSTTTEEVIAAPPATAREPTTLEQITGLTETVRRAIAERDEARADRTAAIERAELAESYGVAMDNVIRARDTEIRDLRERLATAHRALDAATRPTQPAPDPEATPPAARAYDAPRRPERRASWRRPPRRH